jgi:hypothetical protein
MKKLLLAGIVMVFSAGLFAETLTLTGTVKCTKTTSKKTGNEKTSYTLSSDEYKLVRFGSKCAKDVEAFVGKTITVEADASISERKGKKYVAVKKINNLK